MGINSINIEESGAYPFELVQGVDSIQIEENNTTPFDLLHGVTALNVDNNQLTTFELNLGFNSVSIPSKDNLFFQLNIGFNSVSIASNPRTFFNILSGFNGISVQNPNISLWKLRDENGDIVALDGTLTVQSVNGSYQVPVTDGEFTLYPYFDSNNNIIEQTVIFVSDDGVWSGRTTLTPTPDQYVLQLYLSTDRENFHLASFGAWNRSITQGEIINLHNNGGWNNPWNDLPVYYDRNMKKGLQHWLQFQEGSFLDSSGLKVENWQGGTDGIVTGFTDLNEISNNIVTNT